MKKRRRFLLLNTIFLAFFCFFVGCKEKDDSEKVINWLRRYPETVTFRTPLEVIPYKSFDDWEKASKKLNNAEEIILELYDTKESPIANFGLVTALGCVGTERSVTFLIGVLDSDKASYQEKESAVDSLRQLGKKGFDVTDAIEPLLQIASSEPTGQTYLNINAIISLGDIGDERAILVIEGALGNPEYSDFQRNTFIIPALESLKKKIKSEITGYSKD